jgi:hypothetical protein
MRFIHFALFFLILGISACSDEPARPEMTYFTDFESEAGWMNDERLTKAGGAHSGQWYVSSGEFVPFTPSFKVKASTVSRHPLRKAKVSAWVKAAAIPAKVQLVLSAEANGISIYWKSKPLDKSLRSADTWTEISEEFVIPAGSFGPDNSVNIYLWSQDKSVIGLDDVTISFSN